MVAENLPGLPRLLSQTCTLQPSETVPVRLPRGAGTASWFHPPSMASSISWLGTRQRSSRAQIWQLEINCCCGASKRRLEKVEVCSELTGPKQPRSAPNTPAKPSHNRPASSTLGLFLERFQNTPG